MNTVELNELIKRKAEVDRKLNQLNAQRSTCVENFKTVTLDLKTKYGVEVTSFDTLKISIQESLSAVEEMISDIEKQSKELILKLESV